MTCAACGQPAAPDCTIPTRDRAFIMPPVSRRTNVYVPACYRCACDWHAGVNHGRYIPYAPSQLLADGAGI